MTFSNVGVYHDLMLILTQYFNDGSHCKWMDFSNVFDCIRPFFYKGERGYSYMQGVLREHYDQLLLKDDMGVLQSHLLDCMNTIGSLIAMYLGEDVRDVQLNNYDYLHEMNTKIINSSYPAELKSSLYNFIIDPIKTIHILCRTLLDLHSQLVQIYENRVTTITGVQKKLSDIETIRNLIAPEIDVDNVICTVCLFDDKHMDMIELTNGHYLFVLGPNYEDSFSDTNDLEIKEFSYILMEMNRIKILNLMRSHREITIKDIEQELGFSGTNAYYHLSLMTKQGMVLTKNQGRTVLYSINKKYFEDICNRLLKFYM